MKRILDPSELVIGESYWLRTHYTKIDDVSKLTSSECAGLAIFKNETWAYPNRPEAFDRWEIWGPIPRPDWD